jgi:HK97 family phage portal protein
LAKTFVERAIQAWNGWILRSSPESPSTPLSAPADWLFGSGTLAGEHINQWTALQITTVWACVQIISQTIASLPLSVYRKREDGGREELLRQREYYLLHNEPNERMSSCVFREIVTASVLLWGNGYARIDFDGSGKTNALWPLAADKTTPYLNEQRQLRYRYVDPETGQQTILFPENVLHIPGLSFDGICGMSPIMLHREGLGLAKALESFGAEYFGNGTFLSGTLNAKGTLTDKAKERLNLSWKMAHTGHGNRWKVPILEEDMTFTQYGQTNNEHAQFTETRRLQIAEVARIYHVPLHMLAETEAGPTYASAEQFALEFVQYTLRNWLVRWEQELNRKLFPRSDIYTEHNLDGLLRGDFATRMTGYATGRQWGWFSVNDIRRKENMNPLKGTDGDQYVVPMNMTTPERVENPPEPTPAPAPANPVAEEPGTNGNRPMRAVRHTFADAIRRSLNYESKDPVKLQKFVSRAFAPILCDLAESTGGDLDAAVRYADILYTRVPQWAAEMVHRQGQMAPLEAILETELNAAWAFIQIKEPVS